MTARVATLKTEMRVNKKHQTTGVFLFVKYLCRIKFICYTNNMNNIEKKLEYHELLMVIDDLNSVPKFDLIEGYHVEFWGNDKDTDEWVDIHISTGEFNSLEKGKQYFNDFYQHFLNELVKRCFFIVEDYTNIKVATATLSPSEEYGYNCVIDWLAVRKEYQGRGLARPLISLVCSLAQNLGYDKVLLHTQTHTWIAAKLYLDMGFMPFNMQEDIKGWQILKTLTNHEKLSGVNTIRKDEMYDKLIIQIVDVLDKTHKDYTYSVWYKNGANDVYVHEKDKFYHYNFKKTGNDIILENKKQL